MIDTELRQLPAASAVSRRPVRRSGVALARLTDPSVVAGVAIVVVSLLVCWRVVTGRQFETTDLSPVAPAGDSIAACALPYQHVGLGRPNPSPAPGLCDIGALAGLVGPTAAQHIFLVGALMGAGLFAFALLRRLGNPVVVALAGGLLYELSPALIDQFEHGGPSILLTGALLPGVALGFVAGRERSALLEGCRSAALLGLITFFNPQAPVLASLMLAPLLVATLVQSGRQWTWRFLRAFAVTYVLAALPTIVALGSQGGIAAAQAGTLVHDIRASLGATSVVSFAEPYLYAGVVAALVGVVLVLWRRAGAGEVAMAASAVLVVGAWLLFRSVGDVIVAAAPLLGLFRDFIKFQVALGLPIAVLSALAFRAVLQGGARPGPWVRRIALLCVAASVATPLAIRNGTALASGYMGLGRAEVPPVYQHVADALQRLDPSSSDDRILWLPQDFSTNGILGSRFPSSLVYRSDAPPPARDAVLRAFSAVVAGEQADIGPLLGEASVKYIVVNRAYRGEAGAPFEFGGRNIAAVAGTKVLAGSASSFEAALSVADGLHPVAQTLDYVIYRNDHWVPMVRHYDSMLLVDSGSQGRSGRFEPRIPLAWQAGADVDWAQRTDGSVAIVGPPTRSWSPVQASFPALPGTMYQVAGTLGFSNVEAAHAKVIWSGEVAAGNDTSVVVTGRTGTGSVAFATDVVAPAGSRYGTLLLMGGWSQGGSALTLFSDVSVATVTVDASPQDLAASPRTRSGLARELPGTLTSSITSGPPHGVPAGEVIRLGTQACGGSSASASARCARLLTTSSLRFDGSWAAAAPSDGPALEWFTEEQPGHVVIPADASAGMAAGSSVQWAEYPGGDVHSAAPIPHRQPLPDTAADVTLRCTRPGCAIADIILMEPLSPATGITRVAQAADQSLRGQPGDVAALARVSDWASLYPGRLDGPPAVVADAGTVVRWLALAIGNLAVLAGLGLGGAAWLARRLRPRRAGRDRPVTHP